MPARLIDFVLAQRVFVLILTAARSGDVHGATWAEIDLDKALWAIPAARMKAFTPPPQTLPRPAKELDQFIRACKGGPASDASFENVYPFAETIQLGNIALRTDKRLLWDTQKMAFTNAPEMRPHLARKYRAGWELS